MSVPETVCAVVLTYNRPAALRVCLGTLLAQTRPPDRILVVDNASTDDTLAVLAQDFPGVQVLALSPNVGAAGGFVAGMERAYAAGHDWLWLMDDDAYPRPDALQRLLAHGAETEVALPWQCSGQGLYGAGTWLPRGVVDVDPASVQGPQPVQLFAFIGPLISRRVIDQVGLPYAEYYIDIFDWEYSLRLHQAGLRALLVPDSVIDHEAGQLRPQRLLGVGPERLRYWRPAWRMYYDTRNALLTLRRRRMGWRTVAYHLLSQPRQALRELALEPDGLNRLRLRGMAVLDGLRGVSGERPGLRAPLTQKPVLGSLQRRR